MIQECVNTFFKINIELFVKLNVNCNMQNYFIQSDDSDFSSENLSVNWFEYHNITNFHALNFKKLKFETFFLLQKKLSKFVFEIK